MYSQNRLARSLIWLHYLFATNINTANNTLKSLRSLPICVSRSVPMASTMIATMTTLSNWSHKDHTEVHVNCFYLRHANVCYLQIIGESSLPSLGSKSWQAPVIQVLFHHVGSRVVLRESTWAMFCTKSRNSHAGCRQRVYLHRYVAITDGWELISTAFAATCLQEEDEIWPIGIYLFACR